MIPTIKTPPLDLDTFIKIHILPEPTDLGATTLAYLGYLTVNVEHHDYGDLKTLPHWYENAINEYLVLIDIN